MEVEDRLFDGLQGAIGQAGPEDAASQVEQVEMEGHRPGGANPSHDEPGL